MAGKSDPTILKTALMKLQQFGRENLRLDPISDGEDLDLGVIEGNFAEEVSGGKEFVISPDSLPLKVSQNSSQISTDGGNRQPSKGKAILDLNGLVEVPVMEAQSVTFQKMRKGLMDRARKMPIEGVKSSSRNGNFDGLKL